MKAESILGFQLRVHPDEIEQWSPERRATYLLREDIASPLSVDEAVWPRCENHELAATIFADYSSESGFSPNGLRIHTLKMPVVEAPGCTGLIALTASAQDAAELRLRHEIEEKPFSIDLLEKGFKRLGYDVADHWLVSGLMNCGSGPAVKTELQSCFAGALNDCGLFVSAEEAQRFRSDCDQRVAQHAPFVVFGLWSRYPPHK